MKALTRRPGRGLPTAVHARPIYWTSDPSLSPGTRPARLDPERHRDAAGANGSDFAIQRRHPKRRARSDAT